MNSPRSSSGIIAGNLYGRLSRSFSLIFVDIQEYRFLIFGAHFSVNSSNNTSVFFILKSPKKTVGIILKVLQVITHGSFNGNYPSGNSSRCFFGSFSFEFSHTSLGKFFRVSWGVFCGNSSWKCSVCLLRISLEFSPEIPLRTFLWNSLRMLLANFREIHLGISIGILLDFFKCCFENACGLIRSSSRNFVGKSFEQFPWKFLFEFIKKNTLWESPRHVFRSSFDSF